MILRQVDHTLPIKH